MKKETLIWTLILGAGLVLVLLNAHFRGAGRAYVRAVPMEFANVGTADDPTWVDVLSEEALDYDLEAVPQSSRIAWTRYDQALPRDYQAAQAQDPNQTTHRISLARTAGLWLAALFTLFVLSFLYKDNALYKIAESVAVGVTAAYWMVVGFWSTVVPNLFGKIAPGPVKAWAMPGLDVEAELIYLIPLAFGVMLLWRLSPKGGWISRWPLAFIVGTFAGLRLVSFIHADFFSQIRNSVQSLVVADPSGGFLLWASIKSILLVVGVLSGLVYFFFSIEHKGVVGKTAKLGIWFLMVTFGAAFGYTVMGRIALLAIRLEFLFDDWLWLIDPKNQRGVTEVLGAFWQPLATALGLA